MSDERMYTWAGKSLENEEAFMKRLQEWCEEYRFTSHRPFVRLIQHFAHRVNASDEDTEQFCEEVYQSILKAFYNTRLFYTPRDAHVDGVLIDGIKRGLQTIGDAFREWSDESYPDSKDKGAVAGHNFTRGLSLSVFESEDGYTYASISLSDVPGVKNILLRLNEPRRGIGELFYEAGE